MKRGIVLGVLVLLSLQLQAGRAVADEREPAELDVPYEPTHPDVVDAMLGLAGVCDKDVVYDLGCGDGRIVVRAARKLGAHGLGVDLDPQRIREARESAEQEGVQRQVEFREADLMQTDFRPATVVTLYLLPSVNLMLRPKLLGELRPGTRIVSHAFNMAEWEPDQTLEHPRARGNAVYLWVVPAAVGGTWHWTGDGPASGPVAARLEQCFQRVNGKATLGNSDPIAIEEAALAGEKIAFAVSVGKGPAPVKVTFRGVVTGDTIKGTQQWDDGSGVQERPWTAQRDSVDVAGVWQVTDCPKEAKGRLQIERKDGALSAAYTPDGGAEDVVPHFYAWGACVRFEAPREGKTMVYTGIVEGDSAGGNVAGGDLASPQTWTARRSTVKPPPTQPAAATGELTGRQWEPKLGPPQAGDEYVNRQDGSILVWIPGGEFTMGRDDGLEDERPANTVRVSGFWMSKFEVTNRQFAEFHDMRGGSTPMFWDNPNFNQPEQPVVGVLFSEAQAYCDWAGLRLPTEAEWEYAAGTERRLAYPTATGEIGPELANVRGVSGKDGWEFTSPVGRFPPNPLGLYDLAGNAWEWTSCRCTPYPYNAGDGREEGSDGLRVMRGGCWAFPADYAATTRRHRFSAHLRYDYVGIRLARSAFEVQSVSK